MIVKNIFILTKKISPITVVIVKIEKTFQKVRLDS